MSTMVFLRQVVAQIKALDKTGQPIPFDVEYRTFNDKNKSGGGRRVYKGIKLLVGKKLQGKKFEPAAHLFREHRERKNPNHWDNATLNFETPSGAIVKLKLRYITKFNGAEVAY